MSIPAVNGPYIVILDPSIPGLTGRQHTQLVARFRPQIFVAHKVVIPKCTTRDLSVPTAVLRFRNHEKLLMVARRVAWNTEGESSRAGWYVVARLIMQPTWPRGADNLFQGLWQLFHFQLCDPLGCGL